MRRTLPGTIFYVVAQAMIVGCLLAYPAMGQVPGLSRSRAHWPSYDPTNQRGFWLRAVHVDEETCTNHFAVWSSTHPLDANWTLTQLELAWSEFSTLADHWTSVHHAPERSVGPTLVIIEKRTTGRRLVDSTGFTDSNGQGIIFVDISADQPRISAQRERIQAAAARAFLRASGQDRSLPAWVQDGLVEYICGQDLKPREETSAVQSPYSSSWVSFFLEGADAMYAPQFFDALNETIDWAQSQQHFESQQPFQHTMARQRMDQQRRGGSTWNTPVDRLCRVSDVTASYAAWSRDVNHGQPYLKLEDKLPDDMKSRYRDMALILKLLHRSAPSTEANRFERMRKNRSQQGRTDADSSGRREEYVRLEKLSDRLVSHAASSWATRDIDGTLLMSSNTARIEELLGARDKPYRAVKRDGQLILTYRWRTDETLEAWLTDNPENPARPIVKVTLRKLSTDRPVNEAVD